MSIKYKSERMNDVPCVNIKCRFYDPKMTQNCSKGADEPYLIKCNKYVPFKRIKK